MIEAGTSYPVLLVDKNGTNTDRSLQGAGYNSNANSNDLVIGNVSSGNHGITICSPSDAIGTINYSKGSGGGADAYRGSLSFEHANDLMVVRAKSGKVVLRNDGTDTLVATGGKVGIGTEIPSGKLEVADATQADLLLLKRTTGNSGTLSVHIGGADPGAVFTTSGISDDFVFRPGGAEKLRITSDGSFDLKTDGRGIKFPDTQTPSNSYTPGSTSGGGRVGISSEMRYYETGTFRC